MSQEADPRASVTMRDFPGLVLDQDPRDIVAGAAKEQVNVIPFAGQLNVRKGLRPLLFEAVTDAT